MGRKGSPQVSQAWVQAEVQSKCTEQDKIIANHSPQKGPPKNKKIRTISEKLEGNKNVLKRRKIETWHDAYMCQE